MVEPVLPDDIVQWMRQNNWGMHHLEWHTTRQWDRLDQASRSWAARRGWRRAKVQEGEPGNGFEFLAMHRVMLELLREAFPKQADLSKGWASPPTRPDDPDDPLPHGGMTPVPKNYLDAITKLQKTPGSFSSDDDIGLYIETRARPTPGQPFAVSSDPSTGIHNFLHNRFSDDGSPVDMGNPLINLENARFWRLHGWIDQCWTDYHAAEGFSPTNANLRAAIDAEKAHLMAHAAHAGMVAAAPPMAAGADPIPATILNPFRESPAAQFRRLMATTVRIETPDELRDFCQAAVRLELFTLPLYLAAMWSIKPGMAPKPYGEIKTVALQEMLHMALMCNLLIAIGRKPKINGAEVVPIYPDVLPGIIDSDVYSIEALSRSQLKKFLAIEQPQHDAIPPDATAGPAPAPPPVAKTIGDFYDLISDALARLSPKISTNGKLITAGQRVADFSDGSSLFVIREIGDPARPEPETALYAVKLIKEQGEGTQLARGAVDFDGQLAHYYRFQQIDLGIRFDQQPDLKFKPVPDPSYGLPAPDAIFPMAQVPPKGYPGVKVVEDFDRVYSDMLDKLQEAWETDSDAALTDAIGLMSALRGKAQAAMRQGSFGPDFRYLPRAARRGRRGPRTWAHRRSTRLRPDQADPGRRGAGTGGRWSRGLLAEAEPRPVRRQVDFRTEAARRPCRRDVRPRRVEPRQGSGGQRALRLRPVAGARGGGDREDAAGVPAGPSGPDCGDPGLDQGRLPGPTRVRQRPHPAAQRIGRGPSRPRPAHQLLARLRRLGHVPRDGRRPAGHRHLLRRRRRLVRRSTRREPGARLGRRGRRRGGPQRARPARGAPATDRDSPLRPARAATHRARLVRAVRERLAPGRPEPAARPPASDERGGHVVLLVGLRRRLPQGGFADIGLRFRPHPGRILAGHGPCRPPRPAQRRRAQAQPLQSGRFHRRRRGKEGHARPRAATRGRRPAIPSRTALPRERLGELTPPGLWTRPAA